MITKICSKCSTEYTVTKEEDFSRYFHFEKELRTRIYFARIKQY